jgi:hypothetical protein
MSVPWESLWERVAHAGGLSIESLEKPLAESPAMMNPIRNKRTLVCDNWRYFVVLLVYMQGVQSKASTGSIGSLMSLGICQWNTKNGKDPPV